MRRKRRRPAQKFNRKMRTKLMVLFSLILAVLCGLIGRLTYIEHTKGETYQKKVLSMQSYDSKTIPYQRGEIIDRSGTVLATSVAVYNVILDCTVVNDKEEYVDPTVEALVKCFPELDETEIRRIIKEKKDKRYIVLAKKVPYDEVQPFVELQDEFTKVVDLIFSTYKDFGITNYRCVLSLRDPANKEKYHDDDAMWNKAEDALRTVLNDLKIDYTEEIGEAAFYGPKLDVNVQPAVGNEITLSTCQLDFCLPAKFNLSYVDRDGEKKTPVVLHRAILGSLDRFMAYILEETKGNLPTWLAPVQVRVMPVKTDNEELTAYAKEICDALEAKDVRVELDDRSEKLGYRMREGQVQKVPYLLVVGFNEKEDRTVSFRLHGEKDTTVLPLDEFVEKLENEIKNKLRTHIGAEK